MKQDLWHYINWATLNNKLYGDSFNHENFADDGRIHHQDNFFHISGGFSDEWRPVDPLDTYFIKLVKGNEFFLLPQKYLDKMPITIKGDCRKVKLKKSDSQVWNFITGVDSSSTPEKMYFNLHDTLTVFNPVEHTDEKTWFFLKALAFTEGVKCGVCGPVGSGKNANLTVYRHLRGKVAHKAKNTTRAVFWRYLYYNNYINLDEWTTWKPEHRIDVEDLMSELGDENPDIDKFSLDSNKNLMKIKGVNNKSLTFTFNPYSDKHQIHLKDTFLNFDKISDRFPIFYVEGKVVRGFTKPTSEVESKRIVDENFGAMCKLIANDAYWKNNLDKHLHGYDRSKSGLNRNTRFVANLSRLLDVFDVVSTSQERFDEWLVWIDDSLAKYKRIAEPVNEWVR